MKSEEEKNLRRGALAWFAKNSVAANVLMIFLLLGGWASLSGVKKEVFPEFDLDLILINVPYPGAGPEEVEQGIVLAIEEAVSALDDVKEIRSTASEGVATVAVELVLGADAQQNLNDVKAAIDRITSFPEDVERPNVFLATNRQQVVSLVLYGDTSEKTLRELAERTRAELLQKRAIQFVELSGVRPLEVSVEVPQTTLREYGLTLDGIAETIRRASIEIPGGGVKTAGGEVLVRTDERRDKGEEYGDIAVVSKGDGTRVTLSQIANIKDGFAETDQQATYNGKPAVMVRVFRTGDQTPITVSDAVREYMDENAERLPPGVQFARWFDMSEMYRARTDLLMRNAMIGLVLVLLILGLFLEMRLAFWVTLGIPVTFLGSLLFLPSADVSINMISLFAFIVVLGMVVDDAIIVGESVYKYRQDGHSRLDAAIHGVKEVAVPVCFAIITTIIAYMPMLFVPGPAGKFFRVIPIVVISVLVLSLIESLLILPAHLGHTGKRGLLLRALNILEPIQRKFAGGLERFVENVYAPLARRCVERRYLTICAGVAIFLSTVGVCQSGRIGNEFLPKVDGDVVVANARLPYGSSVESSKKLQAAMLAAANELLEENGGAANIGRGIFAQVGAATLSRAGDPGAIGGGSNGSHVVEVAVYMVESDQRNILSSEFAIRWKEKLEEDMFGVESLTFNFGTGPSAGKAVHIELSHPDTPTLNRAATELAKRIADYDGVYDLDDGHSLGKEQLNLELKEEARALGVTQIDLARQVRAAFFGSEAVRQQRGRDEVRTYVRLPRSERESEYFIENLVIRTPGGGEIPLARAAHVRRGRAFTEIKRVNGARRVTVTAEVDQAVASGAAVVKGVMEDVLPEIEATYPGLGYSVGGEEAERQEMMGSLMLGWGLAVLGMFALLAVAFRSYLQPLIVIFGAIPFGIVGAVIGHMIMGFNWSIMSIFGVVALSGVVVNDSLIMVVSINRFRETMPLKDAIVAGGVRRFRPILLTSLTTFFGLAPMILETSVQAKFLIPMAVSLGFGVMAATMVTLLIVPAVYMALEDGKRSGLLREEIGVPGIEL